MSITRRAALGGLLLGAGYALLGEDGLMASAAAAPGSSPKAMRVYVGRYTWGPGAGRGIGIYRLDLATGALTPEGEAPVVDSPSFLAIHPSRKYLYAVNEVGQFQGRPQGAVTAFAVDPKDGKLTVLNQQPSGGNGPCFVTVDHSGRNALVANYSSGSIAVLPIGADGRLGAPSSVDQHHGKGVNPQRQEGPHAHSAYVDLANHFALNCDLGLDRIYVYRFDPAKGAITPNAPPFQATQPGAGPRHLTFHPTGKWIYAINEMGNTITTYAYDSEAGLLKELGHVGTLPEGAQGNSTTAEVQVSPDGRFVYGSNRGNDTLACFSVDQRTGLLTAAGHFPTQGKEPRNFLIDPTGQWIVVANQSGNSLVVFRRDAKTGKLVQTGPIVQTPLPVCVKMVPLP